MSNEQSDKREMGKRPWRKPELAELGKLTELVQGGGGKLSATVGDSGAEPRKAAGSG